MSSPLVSIIITAYNAEKYIKQSIDSVLNQTYNNFELIIVNDGSTDNTELIIKSYSDIRIQYHFQENKGQCVASNYGLSISKGDYIKFFDADDVMNKVHLEAQVKILTGRTDALASCTWGRFYDGNPSSTKFVPETVWQNLDSLTWIKKALSQENDMMGAWIWLIPRVVLEKTGGWDITLSLNNDFEFSIRLLLAVKDVLFAGDAKIYYRSGNSSLSQSSSEKSFSAAIRSTDLACSYLLQKDSSAFMKRLCANRYQEWLYRIYPDAPPLQKEIENKIKKLGGSNRLIAGGVFFRLLCILVGWKISKRIKLFFYRIGYNP